MTVAAAQAATPNPAAPIAGTPADPKTPPAAPAASAAVPANAGDPPKADPPPAAAAPAAGDPKSATDEAAAQAAADAVAREAETRRTADAAAAAPKAPEKYALKVPTGAEDWLDDADLKRLEGKARARDLTNEQAQAVIDEYADEVAADSAAYRGITEAHETFGGAHLVETQRLANVALDRFAPLNDPLGAELRRDLIRSGFGNKLAEVAFLARIGRAMAEDGPVGNSTAVPLKGVAEKLYGADKPA